MSGGAYSYAYLRLDEFIEEVRKRDERADDLTFEVRCVRATFMAHLQRVSSAMREVEWVDSGDNGPGDEVEAIRKVFE